MRQTTLFTMLIVLLSLSPPIGGGKPDPPGEHNLRWATFDAGLAEAQQSKKKILIDVYTTWCGWCKKMDASTYSDGRVASYLQDHYVLIKLDAESQHRLVYQGEHYTEQGLAAKFGVRGYPTTLFLKSNGDAITSFAGYAEAQQFHDIISFIGDDNYLKQSFDEFVKTKGH